MTGLVWRDRSNYCEGSQNDDYRVLRVNLRGVWTFEPVRGRTPLKCPGYPTAAPGELSDEWRARQLARDHCQRDALTHIPTKFGKS